jgi:hypothetical protein
MKSKNLFESHDGPSTDQRFSLTSIGTFSRNYKKTLLLIQQWMQKKKVRTTNQSIERFVPSERNTKKITGGDKIFHDSTLKGFTKRSPGPVEPKGSSTCPILFSI